jgi:hypothetical protein
MRIEFRILLTLRSFAGASQEMLRPYVAFQATLRSAYHAFVLKLEEECKMLLNHQLQVGELPGNCRIAYPEKYKMMVLTLQRLIS